jgi:acyl-CoA thioester hydrolase
MGHDAIVRSRMLEMDGVRLNWEYQIQSVDGLEVYVTGVVTLVAVDIEKGRIMRRLPETVQDALVKLSR